VTHQVIALTAVAEHWLSDLKPWQAVLVADALVDIARLRAPDVSAMLDTGQLPAEGWKDTLRKLTAEARGRVSGLSPEPNVGVKANL
jgi:hypothetical protein